MFNMQYAGRSFTLEAGEKLEVNEACANHVLNSFGQRGLTFLKYGDDEDTVGKEAKQRYEDFKKRQVSVYNVMNEQRKMGGLGYVPPSEKIREYALELGITLLEPYTLKDKEKEGIARANRENEELKAQVLELTNLVQQLIGDKKEKKEDTGEGNFECDVCKKKFKTHLALAGHSSTHKKET